MTKLKAKEDIIIPFNKIGEAGWELKTKEILELHANQWGEELPETKTENEIEELEKRLNTTLPESLKLFYLTFGTPYIGEELQSFENIGWMKDIWVKAPEYGPDFTKEEGKILPFMVTFSDCLGNGNMFCFHSETKEIYYYDHDQEPKIIKMFEKAEDYIKGCLIHAQSALFGKTKQEEAEKWAEEILVDLFGPKIVHKWFYFEGWGN